MVQTQQGNCRMNAQQKANLIKFSSQETPVKFTSAKQLLLYLWDSGAADSSSTSGQNIDYIVLDGQEIPVGHINQTGVWK